MADSHSTTKAPAFQFYAGDFLNDEHVKLMSLHERGAYITLICQCWIEGSLPSDIERLARLVGAPIAAFKKLWPSIEPCFAPKAGTDRLLHPRLEKERRKQKDYRRRQSDAAGKRWQSHGNATALPAHVRQPSQRNAFISVSSQSQTQSRTADAVTPLPTNARSRHPVYTSDRFAVFEWQFDELSKMLGAHFEAFGLDAFFDRLTQESRASGLVIPKAEAWSWLQSQVLAEAKRRGLPLASAVPVRDKAAENRAFDERLLAEIQEGRRAGR